MDECDVAAELGQLFLQDGQVVEQRSCPPDARPGVQAGRLEELSPAAHEQEVCRAIAEHFMPNVTADELDAQWSITQVTALSS